ncbi:NAD-dependent epimerase/dehydratase family protein [Halomonas sp. WWR20]
MNVLITGMAGFIGHALACRLAEDTNCHIVGIDSLNDYYDVTLKQARLGHLSDLDSVRFEKLDLADSEGMQRLFARHRFDCVVHLAAQAGVRHSMESPLAYGQANMIGHLNVLEGCRRHNVGHLVYASSSSVYGLNASAPFSVHHNADHPVSLYAASKKANELMAHAYSHLYDLPTTGLRFFTVYGPWGRPDMAIFKFTQRLLEGRPIEVYNRGDMSRDFTYIDDAIESILRIIGLAPRRNAQWDPKQGSPAESSAPYALYNVGHGSPVGLMDVIHAIEQATGCQARYEYRPMQPGDVQHTWADTGPLLAATGYQPHIAVAEGVQRFVNWYRQHYHHAHFSYPSRHCYL